MADDSTGFFYWYRRYKVRAQDMNNFQTAMVETARAMGEGIVNAAVLSGFQVAPDGNGGMGLSVSGGIATSPSGYTNVINSVTAVDASAATGTMPVRSLVVVQPLLTDANFINSPLTPFNTVPLNQLQQAQIVVLPGTPGQNPDYPAKGPNDVVLCGLIMPANSTTITEAQLDFEVRDSVGVNSEIAQNQVRFDNRLRPYRSAPTVLGVKPSQNVGSAPFCFSYPGRLTPSLFPLSNGSFVGQDTFVDFSTGMISGGDTTTPQFTPVVPLNNNSVVCVVTLTQKDILNFNYGDSTGTYAQCLAAIQNQVLSGPGSLPAPDGNFGIAYVIVTSFGGSISDISVIDGRPFLGSGASAARYASETPSGTVNGTNNEFTLSKVPSDPESLFFFVDENVLADSQYEINSNVVTITDPDAIPVAGQTVYAKYLYFGAVSNTSSSTVQTAKFKQEVPVGNVDGLNAVFQLSSTPVDTGSIDFWVDENHLELTDFTVSGTTITITNPDFIPQLGQSVYAKYLYLGVISGSGSSGGGGTSGYAAYGSQLSPIIVSAVSGLSSTEDPLATWYIKSAGGLQQVTRNPQISAGSAVGQKLCLKIGDSANVPFFNDGNGLSLNGMWPASGGPYLEATLNLTWGGASWSEDNRR